MLPYILNLPFILLLRLPNIESRLFETVLATLDPVKLENNLSLLLLERPEGYHGYAQSFDTCGYLAFVATTDNMVIENVDPGSRNELLISTFIKLPLSHMFELHPRPVVYNPHDKKVYILTDTTVIKFDMLSNSHTVVTQLEDLLHNRSTSTASVISMAVDGTNNRLFFIVHSNNPSCEIIMFNLANSRSSVLYTNETKDCSALIHDSSTNTIYWLVDGELAYRKLDFHNPSVSTDIRKFKKPITSSLSIQIINGVDLYYLDNMQGMVMKISLHDKDELVEEVCCEDHKSKNLVAMKIVPTTSLERTDCFSSPSSNVKVEPSKEPGSFMPKSIENVKQYWYVVVAVSLLPIILLLLLAYRLPFRIRQCFNVSRKVSNIP